ncbi:MAG: leucyl aminopeptidase family protein [Pseudomonadota bacterium]
MQPPKFAPQTPDATPLYAIESGALASWLQTQSDTTRKWVAASGFKASVGTVCLIPAADGTIQGALAGLGGAKDRKRGRFLLAGAAAHLPEGVYALETDLRDDDLAEAALGWLLGQYRFSRFKKSPAAKAALCAPDGVDAARLEAIAAAETLTRDLINTPASHMGPDELEAAAAELARDTGAGFKVIKGTALSEAEFPLINAVGRASPRVPRLLDMAWGTGGPRVTLVGKGVCFDTGGLNLKPGGSMGLMKKDMGGAANVLGLAKAIMELNLTVRLRVLIPAVENAIGGAAFRPGDVLASRKGLTVEINNTDAEGRLVLADALALASEDTPDIIVSMATLTGAARVAVGPDLAPFYTDDEPLAQALQTAAGRVHDPVWRLPFWDPYESKIEPGIADLDNAPSGGFAGSITAALFLRRFVAEDQRYLHFDIYGWQPAAAPGRPKGGVGQGYRAVLECLPDVLGL